MTAGQVMHLMMTHLMMTHLMMSSIMYHINNLSMEDQASKLIDSACSLH